MPTPGLPPTLHDLSQATSKWSCKKAGRKYKQPYTVNVDFVTFEYVLLVKYQYMSIWEFNLPKKQTNLIGP
jgi:hypothetical protein